MHPIPPGTRDVLPDEMAELRSITERLRATLDSAGYGEVWTPLLEYEEVLHTGDEASAGRRLPPVRRAGPGIGAALRYDDSDRAAGGDAAHGGPGAATALLLRARLPRGGAWHGSPERVPSGRPGADRRGGRVG